MLSDYSKKYFDDRQVGDVQREIMYKIEFERLMKHCGSSQGNVLDIGCGTGGFLDQFESNRWHRYGIDISEFAVEISKSKGIIFDIPDVDNFFDIIIYRGSIQHLDRPIDSIFTAFRKLKPGGYIVFLATPNAGGICYRLFQDLPALAPSLNFVVFSDRVLCQTLLNIGFCQPHFYYPYINTPYSSYIKDHALFLLRMLGIKTKFAFWGNMMECYAQKPLLN